MKLSIEDLRVDSYATQLSELDLTEVKGGTTPVCVWFGTITAAQYLAAGVTLAVGAMAAYAARPRDSKSYTTSGKGDTTWASVCYHGGIHK
jgi:hypothetical protein